MGIRVAKGLCKGCLQKVAANLKWCDKCRPVSKYRSQKTVWLGIEFSSRKEACRYALVKGVQDAGGGVTGLRRQVRYPLEVNGVVVATYVADLVYEVAGKTIVEDTKGVRTPLYNLKAKLFRAIYGFAITEV